MNNKLTAFLIGLRVPTLTASFVPIVSAYLYSKDFNFKNSILFLLVLLCAFGIQGATNFFNDAIDFKKGTDRESRLGPKRLSQFADITTKQVYSYAYYCLCFSTILGLVLIYFGGWPILIIGASGVLFSYLYTGSKISLAYNGIADLFVIFYFGVFAFVGTLMVLSVPIQKIHFEFGFYLGVLCNILLLINNLRDLPEDIISNKKTLIVRLGRKLGIGLMGLSIFVPGVFFFIHKSPGQIVNTGILIIAYGIYIFSLSYICLNPPSKFYNKLLKLTSLSYLLHSLLFIDL